MFPLLRSIRCGRPEGPALDRNGAQLALGSLAYQGSEMIQQTGSRAGGFGKGPEVEARASFSLGEEEGRGGGGGGSQEVQRRVFRVGVEHGSRVRTRLMT